MHRTADEVDGPLDVPVVVVGAGPVGIVLALELADAGVPVTLIESGGFEADAAAQDLSEDERGHVDYFHAPKGVSVRRQVGGTSALWGGRCVPFDPIDYEPRAVVDVPGWPVTPREMDPYMARACDWAVCGRPVWNAMELPEIADRALISGLPDGDVITSNLERWSLPTRFGAEYGVRLRQHPLVDLVTGLTCVGIECTADGTAVDHLVVASPAGRRTTLHAQHYVLAPGGLEATRLLMASRSVHPEGIGNHAGHLGRWYMTHVQARVADIHVNDPDGVIYDHELDRDGVYVRRRITLSAETQRRLNLPNAVIWLVNPDIADHRHGSGILSGVYLTLISPVGKFLLAEAIRERQTKAKHPTSVLAHLKNIVLDLPASIRFAVSFSYARFFRKGRKAPGFFIKSSTGIYPLHFNGEHRPHWESRVELSDETDALGLPRLRTYVHFSDDDLQSPKPVLDALDAELREHGVGHVEYLYDDVREGVHDYLADNAGFHQMGTTRFSERPEDGVVDGDLQVHGVEGLYVCSTSVVPTSGHANPTLFAIALAVRLAERIAGASAEQPRSPSA